MPCKRKRGKTNRNRQISSCSLKQASKRVKDARGGDCGNEGDEKG
jgi:hypothetical protein